MSALPHKGFKVVFMLILMISELRRRLAESLRSGAAVQRCSGAAVQPLAFQVAAGAVLLGVNCRFTRGMCGLCVCPAWCPLSFHFTLQRSLFAFVFFRPDFPALLLLSNSIHEGAILHHSVSLYLCLPFIFPTPFCTVEGGRDRGERERWTD